jgi:predicted nuclease of predicted toxin-antitoxin system
MAKYLIDVNLPYYFHLWKGEQYLHQRDLGDAWPDTDVWRYARREGLTIVTKDADFSARVLLQGPPPRVIHVRLGNLRMNELHQALSSVWPQVCSLGDRCRLVNVFLDRLEGIE